jgi:hypothetical protein
MFLLSASSITKEALQEALMKFLVVVKPLEGETNLQEKTARLEIVSSGMHPFVTDRILILSSARNMARGDAAILSKILADSSNPTTPVEVHDILGADFNPSGTTMDILRLIQLRRNKAEILVLMPDSRLADILPDTFTDSEGYARIFKTEMKPGEAAVVDCELKQLHLVH